MPDYGLQDVGDVSYPKRRPWLILLVVLAAGAYWLLRARAPEAPADERLAEEASEVVQEGAVGEVPVDADVETSLDAQALLKQARALENRVDQDPGALAGARDRYLDVLDLDIDPRLRQTVEERLGAIHERLAFTPLPFPGHKEDYVVKRGDSIDRIARRFKTTPQLIQRGNLISNPNLIKAGDSFKILTGTFSIEIGKSRKDLLLLLDGRFFKRFNVGTGKYGKTPVGEFEIYDKIVEPVWWRPDGKEIPFGHPDNILGTRWMAIRAVGDTPPVKGYGIHGTWDDDSIGKAESAGCIRMHNPEVETLFDIVPMGTAVTIVE